MALAQEAHARRGDPALISGYLGSSDVFAQEIALFAEVYALIRPNAITQRCLLPPTFPLSGL